jgi:CheY-like chemotaxis protein
LVVEDEDAVRSLVVRLLKARGFEVLAVANGRLALPVWQERRAEIDLLLTDVVMPEGINGRELAERFQREKADLKVIYTSGYNLELAEKNGSLRAGITFVQKPYRPEHLIQAIRQTMDEEAGPRN